MKKTTSAILTIGLLIITTQLSRAGSATWNLDPTSGDWNTADNWTPATVPNGPADTATFGVSNTTGVSLSASAQVFSLNFASGASAYTITAHAGTILTLSGLQNSSGIMQEFVATQDGVANGGIISFSNGSAPALTHFTIEGGQLENGQGFTTPVVQFLNVASAGNATYDLQGTATKNSDASHGKFFNNSTAGSAMFTVHSTSASKGTSADMLFFDSSSAGSAMITCEGAHGTNTVGGSVFFEGSNSAGTSTITVNGGLVAGALLGVIQFSNTSSAGAATLIANGGVGQGGGIRFSGSATGGTAQLMLFGNGFLDISQLFSAGVTIGSLEGQGLALLGSRNLAVGSNGLSTTYSGVLQDGGLSGGTNSTLTKVGTGTLTLTGANTYTGGTTVSAGTLVIANRSGSGTGAGAIAVTTGTLGGSGIVTGSVSVGTGSGAGAFLAPAAGGRVPETFTISSSLTFNADATYPCSLKANATRSRSDNIVSNGVTISGARFSFRPNISGTLQTGTIFTVISNIAATPISGTFANLADGAILTANGNNFQASYEAGDGNDLTLTVGP